MKPSCAVILVAVISVTGSIADAGEPGGINSEGHRTIPLNPIDRIDDRDDGQENVEPPEAERPYGEDQAALDLGRKVLAVREAIQNPTAPNAMEPVTNLGVDSRYYVMVRGWLSQQLKGDLSVLEAKQERTPSEVKERVEFLKKAIRAIDLE